MILIRSIFAIGSVFQSSFYPYFKLELVELTDDDVAKSDKNLNASDLSLDSELSRVVFEAIQ